MALITSSLLLISLTAFVFVRAADPDPVSDFKSSKYESRFPNFHPQAAEEPSFVVRDVFQNGEVSNGPGGRRAALNTNVFPAMDAQGLTYVHFDMKPCGINLPHTHPRATEMLTMVRGGPLQVGFVDTEGKSHINIMQPGDVTIFPRGLMHFEINVGTEPAFYIAALNSQNPGTLTSGGALFNLPARALATSLNQDVEAINKIKESMQKYGPELQLASSSTCVPGKDITTDF